MRRELLPILLTAAMVALAGCSASAANGSASVYVKDAPTDEFDEIHVVFTKVQVHAADADGDDDDASDDDDDAGEGRAADVPAGGRRSAARDDGNETDDDNETADDDDNATDDDDGSSWKTVFEDAGGVDIDLLAVNGTRAAFLGETDLAPGRYTQLRITVLEAYGIQNGTRVPITVSSDTLKLNHPFTVSADRETRLVVDFDLDRSLHQQGNGSWRMTPVVGSIEDDELDDDESGDDRDERGAARDLDDDDAEASDDEDDD